MAIWHCQIYKFAKNTQIFTKKAQKIQHNLYKNYQIWARFGIIGKIVRLKSQTQQIHFFDYFFKKSKRA